MLPSRSPLGVNRRLSSRRACLLTASYRSGDEASWHPLVVMDLSSNGCRIRVGAPFDLGSTAWLRFEAPIRDGSSAATMETRATVIWTRTEGLSYQIGLRFAEAPDALGELIRAVTLAG
jgi:hypothetical protein